MTIWTPTLSRDKPAYLALADAIAAGRADGALPPGVKLPPHRTLAYDLGLSVGAVTRGYAEAARRGLVRGEVGRGTFVLGEEAPEPPDAAFARRADGGEAFLNLTITRPAMAALIDPLTRGVQTLGAADLSALADYGPAEGQVRHRAAIARWLRSRGAPATADRVVIASGAQNALALAAAGLLRPGDAVAVDPLTYPGFKTAAGLFGLKLIPAEGDEQGMRPDALAAAAGQGARAVYLMPTLHNPTMATMPEARRHALARTAAEHDLLILEDDVYGFLIERPPPLFADIAPDRTALIGSVSKFMSPALRIGWLVPPPGRAAEAAGAIRGLAWMASPLLAEIATAMLAGPDGPALIAAQRAEAAARVRIVRDVLGPWLGPVPDCVMHVWLPLPEPWRADAFLAEAEARGVALTGAGAFAVGRGGAPHAVRFGLGAGGRDRLAAGLKTLRALLEAPPRAGAAVV